MLVRDCGAGHHPRPHAQAEHVTLTAIPRTWLGMSLPQRLNWALQVPAEFDRIVIQSAGATVRSESISWASVRLEGAASRFECEASRLGDLERVGAAQHARVNVLRLDGLRLEGGGHRVKVAHAEPFVLDEQTGGVTCCIEARDASPSADHRLRCRLEGLEHRLKIHLRQGDDIVAIVRAISRSLLLRVFKFESFAMLQERVAQHMQTLAWLNPPLASGPCEYCSDILLYPVRSAALLEVIAREAPAYIHQLFARAALPTDTLACLETLPQRASPTA